MRGAASGASVRTTRSSGETTSGSGEGCRVGSGDSSGGKRHKQDSDTQERVGGALGTLPATACRNIVFATSVDLPHCGNPLDGHAATRGDPREWSSLFGGRGSAAGPATVSMLPA